MSKLINLAKTRQLIKKSFDASLEEIIGEILQNAQRSKATEIKFSETETGFSFQDNGKGLNSFTPLLVIGETDFDLEVIANQNPLGVGFNSLLANDCVSQVTIASHDSYLSIDTKRWWDDLDYAQSWEMRVGYHSWQEGIKVTVIFDWAKFFQPSSYKKSLKDLLKKLAEGYAIVDLQIFLNDTVIPNTYSNNSCYHNSGTIVDYQGNRLKIFHDLNNRFKGKSCINFYGQIIYLNESNFKIPFLLEVTQGSPVDLLAPTRQKIIKNTKWQELQNFSIAAFKAIVTKDNYVPSNLDLKLFYQVANPKEAKACPWALVSELEEEFIIAKKEIGVTNFIIAEAVLLLETEIKEIDTEEGLSTFSDEQRQLYFNGHGTRGVPQHVLVWRTQEHKTEADITCYRQGEYALVPLEDWQQLATDSEKQSLWSDSQTVWHPIAEPVYLWEGCTHISPYYVDDIYLGSDKPEDAFTMYIDRCANIYDSEYEPSVWDEDVLNIQASLAPNTLPGKISHSDLLRAINHTESTVSEIQIKYLNSYEAVITAELSNGENITKSVNIIY